MTLTATIDATGISAPDYPTVLAGLKAQYQGIYGQDVYLEPDSQDGAMLAILALAISDTNSMAVAVYGAFSPSTAQGEGLSTVVKINGIQREAPAYSTVALLCSGQQFTPLTGGMATDTSNQRWLLQGEISIDATGAVLVPAVCDTPGVFAAPPGTITTIATPTRGWQAVTNPTAALLGSPVETDAGLRVRQTVSTALPSRGILDGIVGALANLAGVARMNALENDTDLTDANGLPPHSIALVVEGGDPVAIGTALLSKKAPGVRTVGTVLQTLPDAYNNLRPVAFYVPVGVALGVGVNITPLAGYTSAIGVLIQNAVAAYLGTLPIGAAIVIGRLYMPANLWGGSASLTYRLEGVTVGRNGAVPGPTDCLLAFQEVAVATPASVVVRLPLGSPG